MFPVLKRYKLIVLLSSSVASTAIGAEEMAIFIQPQSLSCLVQNLDNYLTLKDDPLIILLDVCPRTNATMEELMSAAENSVPKIKQRESTPNSADKVIALRKSELKCIVDGLREGSIIPQYVKDSQGVEIARLEFGKCVQ